MNIQSLLDQVLGAGQSAAQKAQQSGYANFGTGMLAGGALGLLLGNKRLKKYGGKAIAYGGAAALGALALKAYQNWQSQKAQTAPAAAPAPAVTATRFLPAAPAAETHSRAVLKAIIAAAKSDGHIDARERGLIEEQLAQAPLDASLRAWIDAEVARPLDPAEVASAAGGSMEIASEMYLASVLVVDEESFMERAYLDGLARALGLPPELRSQLETQARQALAASA